MAEENKKSTFKKLWWLWIIVAFIIGTFVGDSLAINRVNKQIGSFNAPALQENVSNKEIAKEELKIINFTEQSQVGNLGIKVLEAKESNAISNEAGKSAPSGKFVIVKLEIKNNGEQTTQYASDDFVLKNGKTKYTIDDNAFEALGNLNSQEKIYNENSNFVGVYDDFNSGITKNTYIVFDVPKEVKVEDLKLVVKQDKSSEFNLK